MNARSTQLLVAGLGLALVVVLGATIFILLSRPQAPLGPTPTPTGSAVAIGSPTFTPTPLFTPSPTLSASPGPTTPLATPTPLPTLSPTLSPSPSASASVAPTASPSPSPSPSPTISPSPTATLEPTASPTPSASPTPTPSISPTSPQREFKLIGVGLDSRDAGEQRVERVVAFRIEGPSFVSATVTNASGSGILLCLYEENESIEDNPGFCARGRNAKVQRVSLAPGSSTWLATLIGTETLQSPRVDLTLRFHAAAPRVELSSFRFVGTQETAYNGFLAEVPAVSDGDLRIQADFEGESESYRLVVENVGGATLVDESGSGSSVGRSTAVTGGSSYRVSLRSPEEVSGAGFVHAVINWP